MLTWAYTLSMDHQQQANQAFPELERVLRREPGLAGLSLLRVGHGLGCKLLLAPDEGLGCTGAAMLAFNNNPGFG